MIPIGFLLICLVFWYLPIVKASYQETLDELDNIFDKMDDLDSREHELPDNGPLLHPPKALDDWKLIAFYASAAILADFILHYWITIGVIAVAGYVGKEHALYDGLGNSIWDDLAIVFSHPIFKGAFVLAFVAFIWLVINIANKIDDDVFLDMETHYNHMPDSAIPISIQWFIVVALYFLTRQIIEFVRKPQSGENEEYNKSLLLVGLGARPTAHVTYEQKRLGWFRYKLVQFTIISIIFVLMYLTALGHNQDIISYEQMQIGLVVLTVLLFMFANIIAATSEMKDKVIMAVCVAGLVVVILGYDNKRRTGLEY